MIQSVNFSGITLFDWAPFFNELTREIAKIGQSEDRNNLLRQKASDSFGPDSPICRFEFVDPFSFVYYLAQQNTKNQKIPSFNNIKRVFDLQSSLPTDWYFPSIQPGATAFFHDAVNFQIDLLWRVFISAVGDEPINDTDFINVLHIKTVKTTKLTQTLFLINPRRFLPVDSRIMSLPVADYKNHRELGEQIEEFGYSIYEQFLNQIKVHFPGCTFNEINLFAYLTDSGVLQINDRIYQISSRANNDVDEIKNFFKTNSVWTGGPVSGKEAGYTYPIFEPQKGDIMVIRTGNWQIRSISIVLENEYLRDKKWTEDGSIKILRISAVDRNIEDSQFTRKEALNSINDIKERVIRSAFPETFKIIDTLTGKSKIMEQISNDSIKNLILQGPPGSGKTRLAEQLAIYLQSANSSLTEYFLNTSAKEQLPVFKEEPDIERYKDYIKLVQFHPGYTYEDFVRGIISEVTSDGKVLYTVKDKVLMDMVKSATEDSNHKYVLIIDEINRANLPAVIGELIYAIEYRNKKVTTVYESSETKSKEISLPQNLYIIGTMNTADRSIGHIDYAIRRRFIFKDIPSDAKYIVDPAAKKLYDKVFLLFSKEKLAPDFKIADVLIGHSYFLTNQRSIKQRLEFEIKPILREYIKDGILIGNYISDEVENLIIE